MARSQLVRRRLVRCLERLNLSPAKYVPKMKIWPKMQFAGLHYVSVALHSIALQPDFDFVVKASFLMRRISPASILVKPKHFFPRSFSDAPMR